MNAVAESCKTDLQWRPPEGDGHAHLLLAGNEPVGRLDFSPKEGERSAGEMKGRRWSFEYRDLWYPHVTVRDAETGDVVANTEPDWKGGIVVAFASGARFHWVSSNLWGTRWCFRHEKDASGVCMSLESSSLKSGGKVSVCRGAALIDEAPVLMLLVWYLRILAFERLAEDIFPAG